MPIKQRKEAAVKAAKLRLKELAYYGKKTKDADLDDEINTGFIHRLKRFQFFNVLRVSGELTQETLALLHSKDALSEDASIARYKKHPELEPAAVCLMRTNSTLEWEVSGNTMIADFETSNISASRTVIAFELTIRPFDPWGNDLSPFEGGYRISTVKKIKPGEKKFSAEVAIAGVSQIATLYAGVSKAMYSDGTTVEIPDDEILFLSWSGPFDE